MLLDEMVSKYFDYECSFILLKKGHLAFSNFVRSGHARSKIRGNRAQAFFAGSKESGAPGVVLISQLCSPAHVFETVCPNEPQLVGAERWAWVSGK